MEWTAAAVFGIGILVIGLLVRTIRNPPDLQWAPMERDNQRGLMLAVGLLAALLWILSLFAVVKVCSLTGLERNPFDSPVGWAVLVFGWAFGPISASVAWYGNITLLVCIGMLLSGRTPSFWLASVSLIVAVTGLMPVYLFGQWSLLRGLAVWCWLSSFVTVWIPVAIIRWPNSEPSK